MGKVKIPKGVSEKFMKCRNCGKEIVVDEKTNVGVCVGCGKKFVISTVARAKVCTECKSDLVNKGAFWECPNCGKKFSFVNNKKQNENSNVVVTTKVTTESEENGKTTIVETRKESNLKKSSIGESFDIDIGDYRLSLKPTVDQKKNSTSDDVIKPINEDNDYIIPVKNQEDDVIIPTKNVTNEVSHADLIDDADLNEPSKKNDNPPQKVNPSQKKETISKTSTSSTISTTKKVETKPIQTKKEETIPQPKKEEASVQKKEEKPKENVLRDEAPVDDKSKADAKKENVNQTQIMPPIATGTRASKSSRGLSVLCKIAGIVLGILIVLVGIACYVTSHFDLIQKFADVKTPEILSTLHLASTYAFFGLFALLTLLATTKDVRFKRIGTIITLLAPILLILTVVLEKELTKAKLIEEFIYAGYAILVCGSFLTMVITARTDLSKQGTVMGLVLFIFSIISLLVVALQLVPLKALKMGALESIIPYLKDADKVLLGFASISTAVLVGKSE